MPEKSDREKIMVDTRWGSLSNPASRFTGFPMPIPEWGSKLDKLKRYLGLYNFGNYAGIPIIPQALEEMRELPGRINYRYPIDEMLGRGHQQMGSMVNLAYPGTNPQEIIQQRRMGIQRNFSPDQIEEILYGTPEEIFGKNFKAYVQKNYGTINPETVNKARTTLERLFPNNKWRDQFYSIDYRP